MYHMDAVLTETECGMCIWEENGIIGCACSFDVVLVESRSIKLTANSHNDGIFRSNLYMTPITANNTNHDHAQ